MKFGKLSLALPVALALSGCGDPMSFKLASVGVMSVAEGVFSSPDINLKEKNLAAADYMFSQVKTSISQNEAIHFLPLEEIDNDGITSPFGMAIPEDIGLRFAALGKTAWVHDVAAGANKGLYLPPPKDAAADYIFTGRYDAAQKDVKVYLRIIEAKSSRVVAQFDYVMPLNKELRDLTKTQTRIFRVR